MLLMNCAVHAPYIISTCFQISALALVYMPGNIIDRILWFHGLSFNWWLFLLMNFYISVLGIFSADLLTSENFQPTSLRPWNASNPSPFTGISTHSFPKETPNLTFSCMSNALVTDFCNLLFSYNLFSLVLLFPFCRAWSLCFIHV